MTENDTLSILKLMHLEVVPAIGCTEPIAVALAVSKASEVLGAQPQKIITRLSANVLKNAMGVGIPGTGMYGLPIAVAIGVLVGKSEYGLEVLKDVTPETLEQAKAYMDLSVQQKKSALAVYGRLRQAASEATDLQDAPRCSAETAGSRGR